MGVIFWLSSMDSDLSNSRSKKTINKVLETTVEQTTATNISDKQLTDAKINNAVEKLNKLLRKCAHATVYFVLALLLINALTVSNISLKKTLIITTIVYFLYACTDEYHQTFVKGRTGQLCINRYNRGTSRRRYYNLYSLYYLIYKKKKKV